MTESEKEIVRALFAQIKKVGTFKLVWRTGSNAAQLVRVVVECPIDCCIDAFVATGEFNEHTGKDYYTVSQISDSELIDYIIDNIQLNQVSVG